MKTMALKITEDNYPIAVACLPAGFLRVPAAQTHGLWLVINEIRVPEGQSDASEKNIQLTNSWYDEESFEDKYAFTRSRVDYSKFQPVNNK